MVCIFTQLNSVEAVARLQLLTVGGDALLAQVAALMARSKTSKVVVCDTLGVASCVITESVLVHQLGFDQEKTFTTRANQVMSPEFSVCLLSDSLPDVLASMHQRGLVHVAVLDENRRPLGVLNARDGLRALVAQGHYEESLLRNYVVGIGYQ